MCSVTMAFNGQSRNLHIMAGIFSLDNLYLAGKPLCWSGTCWLTLRIGKSSACWDMGGNCHLTWLSSDRLYLPSWIELELETILEINFILWNFLHQKTVSLCSRGSSPNQLILPYRGPCAKGQGGLVGKTSKKVPPASR